jgi:uncharacterized protein involved in exopolysaccharide biosynthesis
MTVYDAEIDLRPYIHSIVRNWWKIGLFVFVSAVIAVLITIRQPKEYEATASLLITRARPSLSLAQEFPTLVEPVDTTSRMNALLSISKSDSLAVQSINKVMDDLPLDLQNIEAFKELVAISNSGDVILVTATANDPELAAKIANAWAEQAVLSINAAYSGEQLPSRILTQLEEAFAEYQTAQTELESFLETSRLSVLERQLLESETLLSNLSNSRAWQIAYFAQRLQNMDQIIAQAEGLKLQLEGGSVSTAAGIGDAIAVLQVRASAFGVSLTHVDLPSSLSEEGEESSPIINVTNGSIPRENFSFDLQIGEFSALSGNQENYERDLDSMISIARSEKSKAEETLQELSQGVLQDQPSELIEQTANQVQLLTAQMENEQAQEKELTSNRDLSWRAYQVLAEKETELRNATQTSNQVSLATQAVPPQNPSSGGLLRNTAIAIVVSLLLGSLVVIGLHWWQTSVLDSGLESTTPAVDLK